MFIFSVSPLFFWTSYLLVQKNKEGVNVNALYS